MWNVSTGALLRRYNINGPNSGSIVAFSPDGGRLLAMSVHNDSISIWNVATGVHLVTLAALSSAQVVNRAEFSPDGAIVMLFSSDSVQIWDSYTGEHLVNLQGLVTSACFSPNGKYLAIGFSDHTVQLCMARNAEVLETFWGHEDKVAGVMFSPDSKRLLSYGFDGRVLIRPLTNYRLPALHSTRSSSTRRRVPHQGDFQQWHSPTSLVSQQARSLYTPQGPRESIHSHPLVGDWVTEPGMFVSLGINAFYSSGNNL